MGLAGGDVRDLRRDALQQGLPTLLPEELRSRDTLGLVAVVVSAVTLVIMAIKAKYYRFAQNEHFIATNHNMRNIEAQRIDRLDRLRLSLHELAEGTVQRGVAQALQRALPADSSETSHRLSASLHGGESKQLPDASEPCTPVTSPLLNLVDERWQRGVKSPRSPTGDEDARRVSQLRFLR
eukprot:Sspe_Gene.113919::Locus_98730_Transcript_1_1_Confidence_1.000_Length_569::g.113919::m.113919